MGSLYFLLSLAIRRPFLISLLGRLREAIDFELRELVFNSDIEIGDQMAGPMSCQALNKVKPYLGMVSLQFGYAGMYIISMVSLKRGMSHYILAVYRHVVATLVIAPFAIVLERFL